MTGETKIKVIALGLKGLLKYIEDNHVAIPEFQRDYVWNEEKVRILFDSLVRGYPIGSFITWKTSRQIDSRPLFIKEPTKRKEKTLILDGQQRLLSTYYLCRRNRFLDSKSDFEEVCTKYDPVPFDHLVFDNRTPPRLYLDKRTGRKFDVNRFEKILERMRYKFSLIQTRVDDYEKAEEIFERINQQGAKISSESIFLAKAWHPRSSLGKVLRNWKRATKKRNPQALTLKLSNILFIHTFVMVHLLEEGEPVNIGLKKLRDIAKKVKENKSKDEENKFKKVVEGIASAMAFLSDEFCIRDIDELPSQTIISLLGVFYYFLTLRQATTSQRKELRKWFWRSSLGSRFTGSDYKDSIASDAENLKRLAKRDLTRLNIAPYDMDERYKEFEEESMYTGRSAIRRAINLMLWEHKPTWLNGHELHPEKSEQKRGEKEDDHFYPRKLLRGLVADEHKVDSVLNLCYLPKSDNSSKNARLPGYWLEKQSIDSEANPKNERGFFRSSVLPFESIANITKEETKFSESGRITKNTKFLSYYDEFLKNRFDLFKEKLNKLQDGSESI